MTNAIPPPPQTYRADWVFPVEGSPIEDGVVVVEGGRIAEVRAAVGAAVTHDFGSAAIIPGLVNAHTHLEFSDLAQPLDASGSFAEWVRAILLVRRTRPGSAASAIRDGLAASAAAGVTTIGEIATAAESAAAFGPTTPRGVIFREFLGLSDRVIDEQLALADVIVRSAAGRDTVHATPALSPHAPYTVHPRLFDGLLSRAREHALPLAFHLAETREELQLLRDAAGPLVELFREIGFWRDDAIGRGTRPLDYLHKLAALDRVLIIHGTCLDDEEIRFLESRPNFSVIYCPRTHAAFGHAPHPWRRMMQRGVRVALGTDSRASNPDLDPWSEVRFLNQQFPDVAPDVLLRLATLAGAEALGLAAETGSLAPGKSADLAIVRMGETNASDPGERLLAAGSRPVATMRGGRWIAGSPPTTAPTAGP